jgi:hypothetical protein
MAAKRTNQSQLSSSPKQDLSPISNAAASALGSLSNTVDFVKQTWAGFGLPTAMAPTVDVAELDKKITDLKAVEQWLEVNQALLRTSIQTLEVQRNTIAAVQAFGKSLKQEKPVDASLAPVLENNLLGVDTQAWWNMLQGQFNQIAQAALATPSNSFASTMAKTATKAATAAATKAATKAVTTAATKVAAHAATKMAKAATQAVTRKRG